MYESSDEEMETGDHQATPTSPSLPPRVPKHDLMMVEEVNSPFPTPPFSGTNILSHMEQISAIFRC